MSFESMFQAVLDLPNVRVIGVSKTRRGEWILRVVSTLSSTACRCCGRTIRRPSGHGERVRPRHLPVFGQSRLQ